MKNLNNLIREHLTEDTSKSLDEKILKNAKVNLTTKDNLQISIFATLSVLMLLTVVPQLKQQKNDFVSIDKNIEFLEYQDQMELMAQLGTLDESKIEEL